MDVTATESFPIKMESDFMKKLKIEKAQAKNPPLFSSLK